MNIALETAIREWEAEVEAEQVRLIRLGVPPWDAAIQARQRIERTRREAARVPDPDQPRGSR